MPRPTKFTTAEARILRAARAGMPRRRVALAASVSKTQFYEWLKAKPDFADALEKAEADGELSRLQRIERAAKEGAWQADAWWLERRFPDEWGSKARVQVDGQITIKAVIEARTAVITALADYPDAQLAVAQALAQLDAGDAEKVAE